MADLQEKDALVLINEESDVPETAPPDFIRDTGKVGLHWDDFKRSVSAKYPRLTPQEVEVTGGRIEALIARIQEKYPEDLNFTREQIHSELGDILARY